ncbi:aspartic peptidase [Tanacetum coccineum]
MLNDPTNQIPVSSSNPGSSTQPSFNQMPYSTASSGSNPAAYQEFMAEQYELDRKAKMTMLERESEDRRRLIQSQRIAEDMRVLQIDTRELDPVDPLSSTPKRQKSERHIHHLQTSRCNGFMLPGGAKTGRVTRIAKCEHDVSGVRNDDLLGIEAYVIGHHHQENMWMEFDVANNRVGFAEVRCDSIGQKLGADLL